MIPGVSEKTNWKLSPFTIPRILWRVVWTLEVIIDSCSPTNLLIRVDFPTLGLPIIFTNPLLCICQR